MVYSAKLIGFIMTMIYVLAALCLFGGAVAQLRSSGPCPHVETISKFDRSRYMGRWYEAERFFAAFEIGAKCVTADYTRGPANTIAVVNTYLITTYASSQNGTQSTSNATIRRPDFTKPGKLTVEYGFSHPVHDYWILGTDYDSYAVVYSCTNLPSSHVQFAWILTRERNPSTSALLDADEVVFKNNLTRTDFTETSQKGC